MEKKKVFFVTRKGARHFGDFESWCNIVDPLFGKNIDDYDQDSTPAKLWKYYTYEIIKGKGVDYQVCMRALEYILSDKDNIDVEMFVDACDNIKFGITPTEFIEPVDYGYEI